MVDYVKLSDMAKRLIAKSGRAVSIIRLNTTPTDSDKPWRGNAAPRATPAAQYDLKAVFVDPASANKYLGGTRSVDDLFSSCEQVAMVATTEDLDKCDELLDSDGTYWKIKTTQKLKPGEVTLIYYLGVAR